MVSDAKLSAAGYPDLRQASGSGIVFVTPTLISAGVGVTLLLRRPLHPVGWLFAALATALGASAVTWVYGAYGLFVRADGAPGAQAALVVSNSVFILWFLFIGWICALTPDGAYLSNRWRLATRVMIVAGLAWFALRMVSPLPLDPPFEAVDNPWSVDSAVLNTIRLTSSVVFNIGLLLAAASLVVRYVRARGEVRRQLMWVAVAAVVFVPLVVVSFIGAMTDSQAITNVAAAGMVVLLPVSATARGEPLPPLRRRSHPLAGGHICDRVDAAYRRVRRRGGRPRTRIRSGREPVSNGDDAWHARRSR